MRKIITRSFAALFGLIFLVFSTTSYAAKSSKKCNFDSFSEGISALQCFRENPIILPETFNARVKAIRNGELSVDKIYTENGECLALITVRAIVDGNSMRFQTTCVPAR